MSVFQLFIDDDRYAVATLRFVSASSEARARQQAETALRESAHHRGAELYRGDQRLFGLGSLSAPGARGSSDRRVGF